MPGKRIQLFCDETVVGGVFGSLTRAAVVRQSLSLAGGAFLHSLAKAMTN